MRLTAIEITGFRRFRACTKLDLDAKLLALVGPNEVGKTSILDVVARLDDDEPIELADRTRGLEVEDEDAVIEALYLIQEMDREAVAGLLGGPEVRWLTVSKSFDGERNFDVNPSPARSLHLRQRFVPLLRKFRTKELTKGPAQPENSPYAGRRLDALEEELTSNETMLSDEAQQHIAELVEAIAGTSGYEQLGETLRDLATDEQEHPADPLIAGLKERRPEFLFFDVAQRDLGTDHDLSSAALNPPPALSNLARLADLSLRTLQRHLANDESGEVRGLLDAANAKLRDAFEGWSQDRLTVYVDRVSGEVIRLHVRDESGYSKLAERSDGLKVFIALVALTGRRGGAPPIVLIDEAERHLHYDGQADLMQVFARQTAIPQIIYTTHSAGCLPEDLGTGVRVVERRDAATSGIRTRFWTHEGGFMPLLLGLGASTLAFVPVRDAVMTEGGSDLILLPSILRKVTALESLGFQVVPGHSEAPAARIAGLDQEAPEVAWITDGDEGGRTLRAKLVALGIDEDRVVSIGGKNSELVLEDLLDSDLYRAAVAEELRRSGHDIEIPRRRILRRSRPRKLEEWLGNQGLRMPNKVDVANRVLELRNERHLPLIDAQRLQVAAQLYEDLRQVLGVERPKRVSA